MRGHDAFWHHRHGIDAAADFLQSLHQNTLYHCGILQHAASLDWFIHADRCQASEDIPSNLVNLEQARGRQCKGPGRMWLGLGSLAQAAAWGYKPGDRLERARRVSFTMVHGSFCNAAAPADVSAGGICFLAALARAELGRTCNTSYSIARTCKGKSGTTIPMLGQHPRS